jgi:hypothetical protein
MDEAELAELNAQREGRAGDRLSEIFTGYGHASVADMAPVMLFFNKLPMHLAYRLFNVTSVGGGQEKSTRYVKQGAFGLPTLSQLAGRQLEGTQEVALQEEWDRLQEIMASLYNKWLPALELALGTYLQSNYDGVVKPSTLTTRSLDVARMFLPFGAHTSQAFLGSARNWVDVASQLRSSDDPQSVAYGDHIIALLSLKEHPEFGDIQANLAGLTKYSEGSDIIAEKIGAIQEFVDGATPPRLFDHRETSDGISRITPLELVDFSGTRRLMTYGEAALASYVGSAYPSFSGPEINRMMPYLTSHETSTRIGEIIFGGHTHHNLMRSQADIRGISLWYESALAFHRDINRQRAFGRNALMLSGAAAVEVINTGHNDNYAMREAEYWSPMHGEWTSDMTRLYEQLVKFADRVADRLGSAVADSVAMNIMPLGTHTNMLLSAPPSQWNYMTSLRVALGGDFGYREDVWKMLELVRSQDSILASVSSHLEKPDANDPEQIVGRS